MNSFSLNFLDSKRLAWLNMQTQALLVDVLMSTPCIDLDLNLDGLVIQDFIREYQDSSLKYLFSSTSQSDHHQEQLIKIKIRKFNRDYEHFQNVDLELDMVFGEV